MRVSEKSKALKALQTMFDAKLIEALSPGPRVGGKSLGIGAIHKLSKELAGTVVEDTALVTAIGSLAARHEKAWLSTEEAARLAGFSRPFIIALLDGPTYPGTVNRSEKGHRRVLAVEFEQWLRDFGKAKGRAKPKTVADVRKGAMVEPDTAAPPKETKTRAS